MSRLRITCLRSRFALDVHVNVLRLTIAIMFACTGACMCYVCVHVHMCVSVSRDTRTFYVYVLRVTFAFPFYAVLDIQYCTCYAARCTFTFCAIKMRRLLSCTFAPLRLLRVTLRFV